VRVFGRVRAWAVRFGVLVRVTVLDGDVRRAVEFIPGTNDPTAGRVAISRELASEQVRLIADPAPLGLGAFALTTFLLSLV
jgi:hypothetical protein